MRIAVYHCLPSGGAKRCLLEWVRRLSETHDLHVFTLSSADHSFCDVRPFVSEHRVFRFREYPHLRYPLGRLNRLSRWLELGQLLRLGQTIARHINSGGFDTAFVQPSRYSVVPTVLTYLNLPAVFYLHEPFGPAFVRHITRPYLRKTDESISGIDPFRRMYEGRLESIARSGISKATVLANSQFTQHQVQQQYKVPIEVCRLGVDSVAFQPLSSLAKDHTVLSVGELTPRKGFDFIIESIGRIPAIDRPSVRIAHNWGSPEERQYLEQLADRHQVRLSLLGYLNTDQLAVEYNRAKICVYAPVMEPFGLVPLEAMACGVPVVGVREGGVCESILDGQNGIMVKRDPEEFATAVRRLLLDRDLARQFGQRGREYVLREWTWEQSTATLEQHLFRAANRTHADAAASIGATTSVRTTEGRSNTL